MGLFWRRKSKDQYVTLGLNEPREAPTREAPAEESVRVESPKSAPSGPEKTSTLVVPAATGSEPTPVPVDLPGTKTGPDSMDRTRMEPLVQPRQADSAPVRM